MSGVTFVISLASLSPCIFLCVFDRCNKAPICLPGQIPVGAKRFSHYIRPL